MKIIYDEIKKQTQKAILIQCGDDKFWIPTSQIQSEDLVGQILEIPEWLAIKKGLEQYEI